MSSLLQGSFCIPGPRSCNQYLRTERYVLKRRWGLRERATCVPVLHKWGWDQPALPEPPAPQSHLTPNLADRRGRSHRDQVSGAEGTCPAQVPGHCLTQAQQAALPMVRLRPGQASPPRNQDRRGEQLWSPPTPLPVTARPLQPRAMGSKPATAMGQGRLQQRR